MTVTWLITDVGRCRCSERTGPKLRDAWAAVSLEVSIRLPKLQKSVLSGSSSVSWRWAGIFLCSRHWKDIGLLNLLLCGGTGLAAHGRGELLLLLLLSHVEGCPCILPLSEEQKPLFGLSCCSVKHKKSLLKSLQSMRMKQSWGQHLCNCLPVISKEWESVRKTPRCTQGFMFLCDTEHESNSLAQQRTDIMCHQIRSLNTSKICPAYVV